MNLSANTAQCCVEPKRIQASQVSLTGLILDTDIIFSDYSLLQQRLSPRIATIKKNSSRKEP